MRKFLVTCMLPISLGCYALPSGFVYLNQVAPSIIEDMHYASTQNFTGSKIPGYKTPQCIVTTQTAEQLKKAQDEFLKKGYSIKVYDCYRPQKAVTYFYKWSRNIHDQKTKAYYYPREQKNMLFAKGYIAEHSGHSRGSTIDLTLVPLSKKALTHNPLTRCYAQSERYQNDNSINMGTRFDCFDPSAEVFYPHISNVQKQNRMLLRKTMIKFGFTPYEKEWWHFTLKNEPFPNSYFDFNIR